jgi:hypothetical protein
MNIVCIKCFDPFATAGPDGDLLPGVEAVEDVGDKERNSARRGRDGPESRVIAVSQRQIVGILEGGMDGDAEELGVAEEFGGWGDCHGGLGV